MMMRGEIFTDPFYGSERQIEFDPDWVVEVEERTFRLFPLRQYRVTAVKFKNGRQYILRGELAAQITAAQTASRQVDNGPVESERQAEDSQSTET